jgi:hypothetical protein
MHASSHTHAAAWAKFSRCSVNDKRVSEDWMARWNKGGKARNTLFLDFLNNNWLPANITGYQCRVHVFALTPMQVTVWCADLGVPVPANWWED